MYVGGYTSRNLKEQQEQLWQADQLRQLPAVCLPHKPPENKQLFVEFVWSLLLLAWYLQPHGQLAWDDVVSCGLCGAPAKRQALSIVLYYSKLDLLDSSADFWQKIL